MYSFGIEELKLWNQRMIQSLRGQEQVKVMKFVGDFLRQLLLQLFDFIIINSFFLHKFDTFLKLLLVFYLYFYPKSQAVCLDIYSRWSMIKQMNYCN